MPSFQTIVAAGKSAAVLHYHDYTRILKSKELILIDCGAEYNNYAADISRTYPVGDQLSPQLAALLEIVSDAQHAAISEIKAGVSFGKAYAAAAKELTKGLITLKVLKGSLKSLLKKSAFKPYFPHGIGHSLGLDVHDIGRMRNNNESLLKKGMVLTIEPGLYFSKPHGLIPACGIRIEDDVLVTDKGCQILSAGV
jgi:Xaa-Pro aminopeptidase